MNTKQTAILASGAALALAAAAFPMVAIADVPQPSAGSQTGTGSTDVYVQLAVDPDQSEIGGTEIPNPDYDPNEPIGPGNQPTIPNPDNPPSEEGDPTSPGKNVAFTVPSSINFVSDASGHLTGPSTYIENLSVFGIHVSSFDVDAAGGWTIIEDGSTATANNSADFQFGPSADTLDAYDYLTKAEVSSPAAWNMQAYDATSNANRVNMDTTGDIFKLTKDITSADKIAVIKTYVTPQLAS